jgi:rhamnosyltransferase
MATFNGGKYLRNQLLSLFQQTYSDWTLYIRDDGSTDNTVDIIDEFVSLDSRIKKVANSEKRLGPARNFLKLLESSTSRYAVFSDQDDIWFEKKLEILVTFAEKKFDESMPCLVYADGHAYSDSEGVIVSQSVSHLHANNLREFLFFNSGYQGSSMLFNQCLVNMAVSYKAPFYMHDDIVSLFAHMFGKVFFVPKPLMLYRQHANNVTGSTSKSLIDVVLHFFRRNAFVLSRKHYEEKREFYNEFKEKMSDCDRSLYEQYLIYPEVSLFKRMGIVLIHGFSIGGYKLPLIVKTLLRRPIE